MTALAKQRTNVSIDGELLREARALGVNLSATLEDGLRRRVAEARRRAWLVENQGAFEDANTFIEKHGAVE